MTLALFSVVLTAQPSAAATLVTAVDVSAASLTLTGPSSAAIGSTITLDTTLVDASSGSPLSGDITLSRFANGAFSAVATRSTSSNGTAQFAVTISATQSENTFRADFAGDSAYGPATSGQLSVTGTQPRPTALELTLPGSVHVDEDVPVTGRASYLDEATSGVAGGDVVIERLSADAWQPVLRVTTRSDGSFSETITGSSSAAGTETFRARLVASDDYAATTSTEHTVAVRRWPSQLQLTAPHQVTYHHRFRVSGQWSTDAGPVAGHPVVLQRRRGSRPWRSIRHHKTDASGGVTFTVRSLYTSRYRLVGARGRWFRRAVSARARILVPPPGHVVQLPRAAPEPDIQLPEQRRAPSPQKARARISRIPNGVWASMVGRSWHRGCPVGRKGLRYVRVSYWGYDGYPHRGELVVAASVADRFAGAFRGLFRAGIPVQSMYRVDRFGWSKKLHGGNDYRSMRAGNTSAFNCRAVVGEPGSLSPHSYGKSLDINTWENVFSSYDGLVPNAYWYSHSLAPVTVRSPGDPIARVLRYHGFRWSYGRTDSQHFDAR